MQKHMQNITISKYDRTNERNETNEQAKMTYSIYILKSIMLCGMDTSKTTMITTTTASVQRYHSNNQLKKNGHNNNNKNTTPRRTQRPISSTRTNKKSKKYEKYPAKGELHTKMYNQKNKKSRKKCARAHTTHTHTHGGAHTFYAQKIIKAKIKKNVILV